MTTQTATAPATVRTAPVAFVQPSRSPRRERDFGVGYGRSSGYASSRSYVQPVSGPRLFRLA